MRWRQSRSRVTSRPARTRAPDSGPASRSRCLLPSRRWRSRVTILIARTAGAQGDTIRTLSVLPMNIVGDSTPVLLLARGFQEELNHELQQIPGLTLTLAPPDAIIAGLSRRQIGDVLGVEHLISSSIRPFGNGYRVEVQLVRLPGDQLRWSERFDVPDARSDETQERLARLVRDRLLATDTTAGLKHIRRSGVQAAELGLHARQVGDEPADPGRRYRGDRRIRAGHPARLRPTRARLPTCRRPTRSPSGTATVPTCRPMRWRHARWPRRGRPSGSTPPSRMPTWRGHTSPT
jgi:TolB-like protein